MEKVLARVLPVRRNPIAEIAGIRAMRHLTQHNEVRQFLMRHPVHGHGTGTCELFQWNPTENRCDAVFPQKPLPQRAPSPDANRHTVLAHRQCHERGR